MCKALGCVNIISWVIPESLFNPAARDMFLSFFHINIDEFAVLAPNWWNELPMDIQTSESLHIFRRKLKTHLFRLYLEYNFKTNNLVALKCHLLIALCSFAFLKKLYFLDSCCSGFVPSWLNALIVSRFG